MYAWTYLHLPLHEINFQERSNIPSDIQTNTCISFSKYIGNKFLRFSILIFISELEIAAYIIKLRMIMGLHRSRRHVVKAQGKMSYLQIGETFDGDVQSARDNVDNETLKDRFYIVRGLRRF